MPDSDHPLSRHISYCFTVDAIGREPIELIIMQVALDGQKHFL
jgi:hypothetical protein